MGNDACLSIVIAMPEKLPHPDIIVDSWIMSVDIDSIFVTYLSVQKLLEKRLVCCHRSYRLWLVFESAKHADTASAQCYT